MHKREIGTLSVKLMALFLAFGAVNSAQSLLNNWRSFPEGASLSLILPFLLSAGIALAMGLLVWISADSIANRIFPESASTMTGTEGSHGVDEIMRMAIAMMGIWLVITTTPSLLSNVALFFFVWRAPQYDSVMGGSIEQSGPLFDRVFDVQAKASIVSILIQLIIGLTCAINPGKILGALEILKARIQKPRTGFTEEDDRLDSPEEQ